MFNGKRVIVTGGARGIGRNICETFLEKGAMVAAMDKDAFPYRHERLSVFSGNLADPSAISGFAEFALSQLKAVDILINNACESRGGLPHCGFEDFMHVLAVGLAAPYELTRLLSPCFLPDASVINIGSTRFAQSQPGTESYTAAKGGLTSLTRAMAVSLRERARVNCISPGWIETDDKATHSPADTLQHPAGRVGRPADISALCCFLASEKAGFITGQNFVADGGMSVQMIYSGDYGWNYELAQF